MKNDVNKPKYTKYPKKKSAEKNYKSAEIGRLKSLSRRAELHQQKVRFKAL